MNDLIIDKYENLSKPLQLSILSVDDEVGRATYNIEQNPSDITRLKKLSSSYLEGGFHHDKVSIIEANFYDNGGFLTFKMNDFFMPSDGAFHLSSILAEVCVLHAGVIYAHIDTGTAIKNREVYLQASTMSYKKAIRDQRFTLEFTVTSKVVKGAIKYYQASVDFNNGCFTGEYSWLIPLNTQQKDCTQ